MFFSKVSRSLLISSISIWATTRRNWPKMISLASSSMSGWLIPRRRMAAVFIIAGSVSSATVKVLGTLMRMLLAASAPRRSTFNCMGSSDMYW